MKSKQLRFAGLVRVSTPGQRDEGASLETQKGSIKRSVDVMRYADQHYEDTLSVWKGVKEYDKKVKLYLRIRDSEKQMCIESYIYDHWDEINKMISDKLDEVRKKKVDDKP